MTSTETEAPATVKRCFSGSGRYANRKWAPGGDASYLSRLRKAHLANETVPDPWYIQGHGGVESEAPAEGWPQLAALDVAQRLDQERGGGVDSHWVSTLTQAAEKAQAKAAAKAERDKLAAATKAEREQERAKQKSRPKKDTRVRVNIGDHSGQEAAVIRTISPTQLLVRFEDGQEELVTDEDIEVLGGEPSDQAQTEAQPEGQFQEV